MRTRYLYLFVVASVLLMALVTSAAALTVSVAASDSSSLSKSQANYLCSGTNDRTQITTAMNAVAASGGGTVYLSEGLFRITSITIPANVVLQGKGSVSTHLQFVSNGRVDLPNAYSKLNGVKLTGPVMVYITASHIALQDVVLYSRGMFWASFSIEAISPTTVLEDIELRDCQAIDCDTFGYCVSASEWTHVFKNLRFINCRAIDCGRNARMSEWVAGFDLAEKGSVDGMLVDGCYASGNYESGFHFEAQPVVKNVVMRNCVSENNGQKPEPMWGAGFVVGEGTVTENCRSVNNQYGYFVLGVGSKVQQCVDTGSDTSFILLHWLKGATLTDIGSKNAKETALTGADQTNLVVTNMVVENCLGSNPILAPNLINSVIDWRYGLVSEIGPGTVQTPVPTTVPSTLTPTPTIPTPTPTIPTPTPTTPAPTSTATPSSQTASIGLVSTPGSAKIFVDGVYKGLTPPTGSLKPTVVSGLTLESHRVEVRLDGYQTWAKTIKVTSAFVGRTNPYTYNPTLVKISTTIETPTPTTPAPTSTATPSSQTASIGLVSTPGSAKIFVDGVYKGLTPPTGSLKPTVVSGLTLESHRVEVRLDGYQTWAKTIKLTSAFVGRTNPYTYNPTLVKL